jgi:GNAT superfamily N-acetyltransferase
MVRRASARPARARRRSLALRLRPAGLEDLELLVAHRRRMWEEIGGRLRAHLDRADPVYRRWAGRNLRARHLVGFVADAPDGGVAGSGVLWLAPTQPRPGRLARNARLPYVMSMYTAPEFRGRGVASRIVRAMMRWSSEHGYGRITLHAAPMGRGVYERLGFVPTNEMRRDLPGRRARRARR